ncbi:MAG TPA: DUF1657 domain-containing protein [Bacillota bacterium]|nr:DUF1657 domain-containing protein [Bacillota bacterium]
MTVGTQVKSCYFTIKQIDAGLDILAAKTSDKASEEAYLQAQDILRAVKYDLEKQIIFIENEEPQYDS